MPIRYGRFEMPKTLTKDESTATDTYATFTAEPFEAGYGHTVGNSLRRVLLSSLEGAAITAVKIAGAQHEFATLPGVVEDVTDIVLNLKKVKFKLDGQDHEPKKLSLIVNKEGQVTAGDIQTIQGFEVLNPKQLICTLDRKHKFDALLQASAIIRHHLDVFVHYNEEVIEFDQTPAGVSEENIKLKKLLNMSVNEIELSVRAANCLNNANITTVGQLAQKTEAEMLKYRNFGKKSLNEIKDKLQHLGLSLGMKFEPGLIDLPVSGDGAGPSGSAGEQ